MTTNAVVYINLVDHSPLLYNHIFNDICEEILNHHNKLLIIIENLIGYYSYIGFDKLDETDAINKTHVKGTLIYEILIKSRNKSKHRGRISIINWNNVKTNKYKSDLSIVLNEYKSNDDFKMEIDDIVKNRILKLKHHYPFKSNHIQRFQYIAKYVLSELPLLLDGIVYKGIPYNQIYYIAYQDNNSKITKENLIDCIIENKKFHKLHKMLKYNCRQYTIYINK